MPVKHDDSAFGFFALTLLVVFAVPATIYVVRRVAAVTVLQPKLQDQVRSSAELAKVKARSAGKTGLASLRTLSFITLVVMLLAAYVGLFFTLQSISSNGGIEQWDPYAILGVDESAGDRAIRSAYRKLSVIHHPDKGGDEETFMNIAKAYKALTDEEARENYAKFNNPDGRQAMEVGLGLPTFMTEGGNYQTIMIVYLLVLVIVVPAIMWTVYTSNREEDDTPHQLTVVWAARILARRQSLGDLLLAYAMSVEAGQIPVVQDLDGQLDDELRKALPKFFPKGMTVPPVPNFQGSPQPPPVHPKLISRNVLLLLAYLLRVPLHEALPAPLAARADTVTTALLGASTKVLRAILGACAGAVFPTVSMKSKDRRVAQVRKMIKTQFNGKRIHNTEGIKGMIALGQALVQRTLAWPGDYKNDFKTLTQLPGFDEAQALAALPPNGKGMRSSQGILEYINTPVSLRGGLSQAPPAARAEVMNVVRAMPNLQVQITVLDPRITEGHVVRAGATCLLRMKLTHLNLDPAVTKGPLYTDAMAAGAGGLVVGGGGADTAVAPTGNMRLHTAGPVEGVAAAAVLVVPGDGDVVDGKLSIPPLGMPEPVGDGDDTPAPEVHAPYFPKPVTEKWWVLLEDENGNTAAVDTLGSGTRVAKKTLPFTAPVHEGEFRYALHFKCNGYVGMDHSVLFVLKVVHPSTVAEEEGGDAEDDAAVMKDTQVTLEEMMQGGTELVDDSDDEDEGAGVGGPAPPAAAAAEPDAPRPLTLEEKAEALANATGEDVVSVRRRLKRKALAARKAKGSSDHAAAEAPVVSPDQ